LIVIAALGHWHADGPIMTGLAWVVAAGELPDFRADGYTFRHEITGEGKV
jgi:hypothetical protein